MFFFFVSLVCRVRKKKLNSHGCSDNYVGQRESFGISRLVLGDHSAAGKSVEQPPKIKYSVL